MIKQCDCCKKMLSLRLSFICSQTIIMTRKVFLIILLLTSTIFQTGANAKSMSLEDKLLQLDECLKSKPEYDKAKEKSISKCKDTLHKARSLSTKYHACIRLYDEYKSYQYDSAYAYANRSQVFARRLNNADYQLESECAMVFCLLSAGLYKEAFDNLDRIDASAASPAYKKKYYSMVVQLNYAIADYNRAGPYHGGYVSRGNAYTDSLLALLDDKTREWKYAVGQRQMKEFKYTESRATFTDMLRDGGIDTHTKAIITSCMGWMYWHDGDEGTAMRYLADAAMYDVQSSTKETTALRGLAELLYKSGDIQRATDYIQFSLDDANFYGARQRKIEVGEILPIIETNRYEMLRSKTNLLIGAVTIISVLVLVILVAFFYLYRQKKILQKTRNVIRESNDALQKANRQLHEANNIKNEYIGNSFYFNSEFIDRLEKLYRMVDRKIQARQYDDLRYSLKESTLNKERDNMYTVFDSTFLKIFPDFIGQYNSLFPESERKVPDKEMSLTTEMRIFALIRLGITESERIAKFLKYSVHTINTYKTRVKNKSLIENDMFEKSIMQIGCME